MRRLAFCGGLVMVLTALAGPLAAQETGSIDQYINNILAPVSDAVASVVFYGIDIAGNELRLVVVWLVVSAVFFTLYLRFINLRGFIEAVRVVRGSRRAAGEGGPSSGEITHFQALTAALSGTVGLGNIAGVAVAISVGGPGAMLWMIFAGFFGMASKFVECSLGAKYRVVHEDGSISGGPMYYLSRGLAEHGLAPLGKFLAVIFAVMCVGGALGAGNMFQANQAYQQFIAASGGAASFMVGQGWLFGLVLSVIVALVIIGGIRSIASVTEKIVPFMGLLYLLTGSVVILMNIDLLPAAAGAIVRGALAPEAGLGGLVGVLIVGFQRATFSNEAGIGSAPIAYASVRTGEPLSVGFVSLLEPFIDTIIICSMTALVIVISGAHLDNGEINGVSLTSAAFATAFSWFPYILAVAVILFAFSTIITWSYYGLKAWTYLFGETLLTERLFKVMFCGFTVLGAAMELGKVIQFSDAMIFAMAFPNAIGMYILARGIRRDLAVYEGKNDRKSKGGKAWN